MDNLHVDQEIHVSQDRCPRRVPHCGLHPPLCCRPECMFIVQAVSEGIKYECDHCENMSNMFMMELLNMIVNIVEL